MSESLAQVLGLQFPDEKLVSCSCSGFSGSEMAVGGMKKRPSHVAADFWNRCLRSEQVPQEDVGWVPSRWAAKE